MGRYFDPVIYRLVDALRGIMPGAHDDDLYWSYHFLSGALTLTFAETGQGCQVVIRCVQVVGLRGCAQQACAAIRGAGFRELCLKKHRHAAKAAGFAR